MSHDIRLAATTCCSRASRHRPPPAARLVISPRTVERHLSNVYAKLHLTGKAARAAAAARYVYAATPQRAKLGGGADGSRGEPI